MLESPATDPGRAADQTMRDSIACFLFRFRYGSLPDATWADVLDIAKAIPDGKAATAAHSFRMQAETLLSGPLAQLQADLIAARKERDEATRLLRVLNEETVLAGYPCGDRDRTLANLRALRSDLIALAKMYGEACGELAQVHWFTRRCAVSEITDVFEAMTVEGEEMETRAIAAENLAEQWKATAEAEAEIGNERASEAAQLRARLHEAEKGKTVDLDTAMKRGIRSWSAKLHIPVTRMMSRVLREEIHAALTPAPEANQEAGDGR